MAPSSAVAQAVLIGAGRHWSGARACPPQRGSKFGVKTDLIDRSYLTTHGDAPQPRRWLGRLIALGILMTLAAAYVFFYAPQYLPASVARFAPARQPPPRVPRDDGPVPVLAAVASRADVPLYFDGVGSSRALNTVTVRAQVDGKLMSVNFKEGQDVDQGRRPRRNRADRLSGPIRSGGCQEGAGRSPARQRAARSRSLRPARCDQFRDPPAIRYAKGAGGAARSAGAGRPGRDR